MNWLGRIIDKIPEAGVALTLLGALLFMVGLIVFLFLEAVI